MPYTILLLALAVTGYFITLAIYRIYFHALSEYPGPKLWIATRLMFVQSMLRGNNIRDVAAIHKKYGDVVRIAPNELSYAKTQAWDDIFGYRPGHREFPRNPVWWTSPPGQPSSFTTANDVDHPRMRKVLSHAFSDKALRDMEPTLQKYTRLLISRLRETISRDGEDKNVVNIVDWYRFTMFDIIGDLLFNEPFDCLSNCQFHWWIQGVSNAFKINAFLGCIRFFPGLESLLYKFMPQSLLDIQRRHYQAVIDKTQKRIAEGTERPDIMSYLIRNNDSQGMTMSEIESSMNVLSIGGSHNTASTLSGITNYLTKNSTCLQRLNAEIRSTYKTDEDITLANLSGLPYLNAVINEGLRMAPPFPAGLPRCVPEGGDTICGEFIPGGTHVQVNSWALQRVSSAFALPDDFIPERWLDAKDLDPESAEIFANDEHEAVQQFSVGPRACLGKQFAYAEMRLVLASIVLNFDIEKVNSPRGRVQWENQKTYMVVEEEPFDVRLIPYNAV